MKTVPRIGNGELGVTAVDGVTGKAAVIAKILSAGSAIRAIAVGPAKPRDAHAISDRKFRIFLTDLFHMANNLMTWYERQFWIRQFAIDHVKVSAANRAGADAHEQLSFAWLRLRHIAQLQGSFRFVENHGAHKVNNVLLALTHADLTLLLARLRSPQAHEHEHEQEKASALRPAWVASLPSAGLAYVHLRARGSGRCAGMARCRARVPGTIRARDRLLV